MQKDIKTWYFFAAAIMIIGYLWIFSTSVFLTQTVGIKTVCLFKTFTNIPCPSCGITRATRLAFDFNFTRSFTQNPLGLFAFLGLITTPIWILRDVLLQKTSLKDAISHAFLTLKKLNYAAGFFIVMLGVWIWNIFTQL